MKRTTRTYWKLCTSCAGGKQMLNPEFNPNTTGSNLYVPCIVCNGCGTQQVVEVIEED